MAAATARCVDLAASGAGFWAPRVSSSVIAAPPNLVASFGAQLAPAAGAA